MKYGAKVDANQKEIVAALRKAGCSVQHLHAVGAGCPDLLCAIAGKVFLIEVKDGARKPSGQALTPAQEEWHSTWKSAVYVVNSVPGALAVVALYSERQ